MKLELSQQFPSPEEFKSVQSNQSDLAPQDVVLIHGTGSSSNMWIEQVKLLNKLGHRCFLPNLRGHGGSSEPGQATGIAEHVDDVLETLAASDIKLPAIFIGHSLGAMVSVGIAQLKPQAVSQILAAGWPGRVLPPVVHVFRLFMMWPHKVLKKIPGKEKLDFRTRTLLETDSFSLEEIARQFRGVNYIDGPLSIDCPVHLSNGRFDPVAPLHYTKQVHKRLSNSSLTIFEWSAHNFMDYNTEMFNQWIAAKLPRS